jgi:hypothetical protein
MRSKFFQFALVLAILTPSFVAAAETKHQTHLNKDHVDPLTALKEAVTLLSPAAAKTAVTPQELDLFQAIAHGRASKLNANDVVLTVAGVTTEKDHLKYTAKLDKILSDARKAVANAKNPTQKANMLTKFLHDNPLHGGGEDNQVDMLRLLDTGKYNCVSSAILFNSIGRKLGLKTRAMTIPGHVFLQMDDLCIEPAFGMNYDAKSHEQIIDQQWKTANDFWKGVFGTVRTFESGNLGLVGQVYYNKSNIVSLDKHYEQSATLALKALCLEPKHPMFTLWLKTALENWFNDTLQQKNYSKAQKIAAIYGQLYGDDSNKLFEQVAAARNARAVAKG